MRLKDVLQTDIPFSIAQLPELGEYRPLLKDIKNAGEVHVILDCSADKVLDILRQARTLDMLNEYQSYVITSLDAHTVDFHEFTDIRVNITALRIFDPDNEDLKAYESVMIQRARKEKREFHTTSSQMKV